ncbi:MAG: YcxB family protein [Anaerovoracaceae bacterium]|jgi:hypothetical protein|nr:YcxB family protein [Clostridiales bacterium]
MTDLKNINVKVEGTVNSSDYQALRMYLMYKKYPKRTKAMVLIFLISFLCLIISQSSYSMFFFKHLGLIGIIIIAGIYGFNAREVRNLEPAFNYIMDKKQTLNISNRGVSAKWENFDETYNYEWSDFEYAVETDSHFFLFLEKYDAITVTKLTLKEYQINEIRQLIENNIKLISETSGWKPRWFKR